VTEGARRALVTGAGRGIGRACALGLAADGADVTLLARTRSELDEVAREVRRSGRSCHVVAGDVTDVDVLSDAFGRAPVDVLVNVAGANHPEPFVDVPAERFDGLIALNLWATFFASQLAARSWLQTRRPGVIVNVSSQMGHVGAARRSVYCAAKHAVEGLTKALAVELGPSGIRVVSVAPTFVETSMTAAWLADPSERSHILSQIPLGTIGTPEDVASAVVFAASPGARLLNGTSLVIDGGWTAK
jgi:NAD(P)-dependent dehydrogenase (short-subunit alcohol dehydrogenase family)